MISTNGNEGKWQDIFSNHPESERIASIVGQIHEATQKWMNSLQESSQIWINFMMLKVKSFANDFITKTNMNDSNLSKANFEQDLGLLIAQTSQCVLKGIRNLEKLYMVPELRQRSITKTKQSENEVTARKKSSSVEKGRSSSYTSSRNRKINMFNHTITKVIQPIQKIQAFSKNSFACSQQTFSKMFKASGGLTKTLKQKPKSTNYNDFGSTVMSKLPVNCRDSHSQSNTIEGGNQSVMEYFQQKQRKKQTEILKKVSSQFQFKLKNMEQDLTGKLNAILQNITQMKGSKKQIVNNPSVPPTTPAIDKQNIIAKIPISQQTEARQLSNYQLTNMSHQIRHTMQNREKAVKYQKMDTLNSEQNAKTTTSIKKYINNVVQQNQDLQEIEEIGYTINTREKKTQSNKMDEANRLQMQRQQQQLRVYESNFRQFIKASGSKFPSNNTFFPVFIQEYCLLCQALSKQPNIQGLEQYQQMYVTSLPKDSETNKSEIKQQLKKLRLILKSDKVGEQKVQKIKHYTRTSILCVYNFLLQDSPTLSDDLLKELKSLIDRL